MTWYMDYYIYPKINDVVHETLYLYNLNMTSSWNIALTGASFLRCNKQWCSFLTAKSSLAMQNS